MVSLFWGAILLRRVVHCHGVLSALLHEVLLQFVAGELAARVGVKFDKFRTTVVQYPCFVCHVLPPSPHSCVSTV